MLNEYTVRYTTLTLTIAMKSVENFNAGDNSKYKIPREVIEKLENCQNLKKEIIVVDDETGSFYSGTLNSKNQKHGFGVFMKKNGERYEGFFENDVFNSFGRYINEKGEIYEGLFDNWKLNGEGKLLKGDKHYEGTFFYGSRNGLGREISDAEDYEGTFKNDKKDGRGKLFFIKSGNTYTGDFKEGKMTGNCEFLWKNGDRYEGNIVNGVFDGRGKYFWNDGMEYEGNYDKGVRRGFGVFKWKDGKIYKGEFENNVPHGNGVIIHNGIEKNVKSQYGSSVNATMDSNKQNKSMKKTIGSNEDNNKFLVNV